MTSSARRPAPLTSAVACLCCYVRQALDDDGGCDGTLRRSLAWAAEQPASTTWLRRWLQSRGGFCDCEVLMNALGDNPVVVRGLVLACAFWESPDEDEDEDSWYDEEDED